MYISSLFYSVFLTYLTLILSFAHVRAQKYQEGYVVLTSNDTLRGYLKDRKSGFSDKLYKKVRFKTYSSTFHKKYSPKELDGYLIGDKVYKSLWFETKTVFLKTEYISVMNSGEKQFLRVLSDGKLTYYSLEFIDSESGYIDEIPLFKRKDEDYFIRVTQGLLGLKKNSLITYFSDCQNLVEMIENKELKSPLEIAKYYNTSCEGN
jgi:hypothetical protein